MQIFFFKTTNKNSLSSWYNRFCSRESVKKTWPAFYHSKPNQVLADPEDAKLPSLAGITFFDFKGGASPNGFRVALALEEKGVKYTKQELDFMQGDHKKPEFLSVNPRGQVPALKDGSVCLNESVAIIEYLDSIYAQNPLMPTDKAQAAIALVCFIIFRLKNIPN